MFSLKKGGSYPIDPQGPPRTFKCMKKKNSQNYFLNHERGAGSTHKNACHGITRKQVNIDKLMKQLGDRVDRE